MKITLNNRPETIEKEQMTLQELIEYKTFTFKLLVTKINGELVKRDERDKALVKDGDNVMVMHLVSGG
jgi:thiamine biosynthesis protein ThiS